MKHQTEKTVFPVGDSTLSDITKYNGVYGEKAMRSYRIKVKVGSSQEEMAEFIRFTAEIGKLRSSGTLTVDKEDPSTFPSFIIHFPKENDDNSYFVIKQYSIVV